VSRQTGLQVPLILTAVALVSLAAVALLPRTSAPTVPNGIFHDSVINDAGCVTCHTPGRQAPLRLTHTAEPECLNCHDLRALR